MVNVHVNKVMLACLYVIWIIPVVDFIVSPRYSPHALLTWVAMGGTILFSLLDRRFIALGVPFVGMLSPLAHGNRIMGLLPSEIFMIYSMLFCLFLLLIKKKNSIKLLPGDTYLLLLVFICAISYLFSYEYMVLMHSMISWFAIVIFFIVTRMTLDSTNLVPVYLVSLLVVASYASALIVSSFVNGMPLANFMSESGHVFIDKDNVHYLFRASYFYTNILYILGAASIVSFVGIITTKKNFYKISLICFFTAMFSTLFIMFAKTGLVALAVSLVIIVMIYYSVAKNRAFKKRGKTVLLLVFFASLILLFVLTRLSGSSDYYRFDASSLHQRLIVASSTFEVFVSHPERLIVGFGPDSSKRVSNEVMFAARTSGLGVEGAIDSAYITFIFEHGVIFFIIFVFYGIHTLLRLFRGLKHNPQSLPLFMILFGIIVFFYISAFAQVIGTSKVAWIVSQIFALIGISISRNNNILKWR